MRRRYVAVIIATAGLASYVATREDCSPTVAQCGVIAIDAQRCGSTLVLPPSVLQIGALAACPTADGGTCSLMDGGCL